MAVVTVKSEGVSIFSIFKPIFKLLDCLHIYYIDAFIYGLIQIRFLISKLLSSILLVSNIECKLYIHCNTILWIHIGNCISTPPIGSYSRSIDNPSEFERRLLIYLIFSLYI